MSKIEELRALVEYHNNKYYNEDAPEISDQAYDAMVRELRALEAGNADVVSPTQKVGGEASSQFGKVKHAVQLQSLRDVFEVDEAKEWWENSGKPAVIVEPKIDGLSLAVTYKDGKRILGATRGDGFVGEDVTANVAYVAGIPESIKLPAGCEPGCTLTVRMEVIMPVEVFESLNEELNAQGKKLFANPRNAAAGSLRTKDPMLTKARQLSAIAFQIMDCQGWADPKPMQTQNGDVHLLHELGFNVVDQYPCNDFGGIQAAIDCIDELRPTLPYWTDGAVIKVNDIQTQKQMGAASKYPHWAVAYKYPPEQKETVVKDVIFQTGRTGAITPVAVFEPVLLGGTSVSRATLHNQQFADYVLGGVCVGDTVLVHKSGEIIPEVIKVIKEKRPAGATPFTITTCPTCGAPAALGTDENGNDGVVHVCTNPDCPAKLGRHLEYWAGKHVMDIANLGPALIADLMDAGKLNCVADLYRLTLEDVAAAPNGGAVRGPKLLKAIEASKGQNIDRLIAGLGMLGVGRKIGETLAEKYKDIWEIAQVPMEELKVKGVIGDVAASVLYGFFHDEKNINMLRELESLGVNTKSLTWKDPSKAVSLPFTGLTFVVTGTLPTMSRDEATEFIKQHGGTASGSVSKKTSYLVAGEAAGSKLKKAQDLGIPIIDEAKLREMAG